MSDGTYRGRWMDEVCGSPHVSAEVKVLLLTMARWMDDAGFVSVPRDRLASLLKCAPRNITAKQKAARDAGLLEQTAVGGRGRQSAFQAVVPGAPDADRGTTVVTQTTEQGDDSRHPNSPIGGRQSSPYPGNRVTTTNTLSTHERVTTGITQSNQKGDDSHPPKSAHTNRNHARAHSKQPPQPQDTHTTGSDEQTGATVVRLFDEKTTTGETHTPARRRDVEDQAFAAFWAVYPRKVAKGGARKAWDKAIKNGADPAAIILGARRYNTDPRRSTSDIRYTAHPATWLNQERWTDEEAPPPAIPAPHSVRDDRVAQAQAGRSDGQVKTLAEIFESTGHRRRQTIPGELL